MVVGKKKRKADAETEELANRFQSALEAQKKSREETENEPTVEETN